MSIHSKFTLSLITKLNKMKNVVLGIICIALMCSCEDSYHTSEDGVLVPLTVLEDSSIPSIEINGVLLHTQTYGNPLNPMVVVLHGGPGADFRSQLNFKQLADEGYFVVFYDQRGSGLSERLDADQYDEVQLFIDELHGVIDYYRQSVSQKLVLAGHSWGAMLATAYINQNPNFVDGVILAEPGGFNWEETEAYISRTRILKLGDDTTNDFVYQDQFITADDHNTLDYKMALSLAGQIYTGDNLAPSYWRYGYVCNQASIELAINNPDQMDFTQNLKNHERKILFAYSELNEAYGKDHADLLSEHLLNVELIEIKACGHEIPEFGWESFYPEVIEYLDEVI